MLSGSMLLKLGVSDGRVQPGRRAVRVVAALQHGHGACAVHQRPEAGTQRQAQTAASRNCGLGRQDDGPAAETQVRVPPFVLK